MTIEEDLNAARAEVARLTDAAESARVSHMRTVAERDQLAEGLVWLGTNVLGAVVGGSPRPLSNQYVVDHVVAVAARVKELEAGVHALLEAHAQGIAADYAEALDDLRALRRANVNAFAALVDKLPDLPHGGLASGEERAKIDEALAKMEPT